MPPNMAYYKVQNFSPLTPRRGKDDDDFLSLGAAAVAAAAVAEGQLNYKLLIFNYQL